MAFDVDENQWVPPQVRWLDHNSSFFPGSEIWIEKKMGGVNAAVKNSVKSLSELGESGYYDRALFQEGLKDLGRLFSPPPGVAIVSMPKGKIALPPSTTAKFFNSYVLGGLDRLVGLVRTRSESQLSTENDVLRQPDEGYLVRRWETILRGLEQFSKGFFDSMKVAPSFEVIGSAFGGPFKFNEHGSAVLMGLYRLYNESQRQSGSKPVGPIDDVLRSDLYTIFTRGVSDPDRKHGYSEDVDITLKRAFKTYLEGKIAGTDATYRGKGILKLRLEGINPEFYSEKGVYYSLGYGVDNRNRVNLSNGIEEFTERRYPEIVATLENPTEPYETRQQQTFTDIFLPIPLEGVKETLIAVQRILFSNAEGDFRIRLLDGTSSTALLRVNVLTNNKGVNINPGLGIRLVEGLGLKSDQNPVRHLLARPFRGGAYLKEMGENFYDRAAETAAERLLKGIFGYSNDNPDIAADISGEIRTMLEREGKHDKGLHLFESPKDLPRGVTDKIKQIRLSEKGGSGAAAVLAIIAGGIIAGTPSDARSQVLDTQERDSTAYKKALAAEEGRVRGAVAKAIGRYPYSPSHPMRAIKTAMEKSRGEQERRGVERLWGRFNGGMKAPVVRGR